MQARLHDAESELDKVSVMLAQQEEMVDVLQNGDTDNRLADWSNRIATLKINELRLARTIAGLQDEAEAHRRQAAADEDAIAVLEEKVGG